MQYENIYPESPKDYLYKEVNEDEIYQNIFPMKFISTENLEEINLDNIYYLNNVSPKSNNIKKESNPDIQDPNSILLIDDYETVFNKLDDDEKDKENCFHPDPNINEYYEREEYNRPYFLKNPVNEIKCFHMENEDDELFIKIDIPKIDKNKESKENNEIIEKNEIKENIKNKGNNENIETIEIIENIEKKEKIENQLIKEDNEIKKPKKVKKETDLFKTRITKNKNKNSGQQLNQKVKTKRRKRGPYKKKGEISEIIKVNTEDKSFPFTTGKGLLNCINPTIQINSIQSHLDDDSNLIENGKIEADNNKMCDIDNKNNVYKDEKKIDANFISNEQTNSINDICLKFTTKKYFKASNGRIKKVKRKRKFKPDDIRKKIKARFHKLIKNLINENLKHAGSQELFDFMPQSFIGNVAKKLNSKVIDFTYKELILYDFNKEINTDYLNAKVDYAKFYKNKKVLQYLEDNPEISKRSGFDIIKDMKYKDLLKMYFSSAQFEKSIFKLKSENESSEYILEYIYRAKTYINFYSN